LKDVTYFSHDISIYVIIESLLLFQNFKKTLLGKSSQMLKLSVDLNSTRILS